MIHMCGAACLDCILKCAADTSDTVTPVTLSPYICLQGLKMCVLRPIEVVSNERNRNQDSSDRNRTHSLNEEALRRYVLCCNSFN